MLILAGAGKAIAFGSLTVYVAFGFSGALDAALCLSRFGPRATLVAASALAALSAAVIGLACPVWNLPVALPII